ncbi:hypothetical protein V6Z12_A01G079200 [Gossypium hirsutum]
MAYFLGMRINKKQNEVFTNQKKYASDILKKLKMENCKETTTRMCQKEKLSKNDEVQRVDETLYRRMVGSLMYLTSTRLDILHIVHLLSRFTNFATITYFRVAKRMISVTVCF